MKILAERIRSLGWISQWVPGTEKPENEEADWFILPTPSLDAADCLNGSNQKISGEAILSLLPEGCSIAAYLPEHAAKVWRKSRPDIHLVLMNEEEAYLEENGKISAEGAVLLASGKGKCLFSANCIVLGYGHLGRALCAMLRGLGAEVTAVGRRGGSLEKAAMDGVDFCGLDAWTPLLKKADWVLNTIPKPVVGSQELRLLRSDAALMELASAPYGIDADAARSLGLAYFLESSIPGRLYPRSAAEAMLSCWRRISQI